MTKRSQKDEDIDWNALNYFKLLTDMKSSALI